MDGRYSNNPATGGHNELNHNEAVSLRAHVLESPQVNDQAVVEAIQPPISAAPNPNPNPNPTPGPTGLTAEQPISTTPLPVSPYALPSEDDTEALVAAVDDSHNISWTASEFVAHPKTPKWYVSLAGVSVFLAAVCYLISRDFVTVAVVIGFGLMFGYVGSRKPRVLQFQLGNSGILIGQRFYPYAHFNSFTVIDDGAFSSIDFMPLKRFSTVISIYYEPARESEIMELLTQHLPFDRHPRSPVDGLMKRIRF